MTDQLEERRPERPDVAYYWCVACLAFLVGGLGGMAVMDSVQPPHMASQDKQPGEPRAVTIEETVPHSPADTVEETLEDTAAIPGPQARKRAIAPEEHIGSGKSFISLFGDAPNPEIWRLEQRNSSERGFWRNDFHADMIRTGLEGLTLSIDDHPDPENRPWKWVAGEMRSHQRFGYGRYETYMRAAPGSGLISAFFTFTGQPFGDPQDEIDIEFNGANPKMVELNAWQDGKPFAARKLPVPFDTSEEFHLYAFDWHPDSITWYIDGVEVHRVEAQVHDLPSTPGFLYMNVWTGKMYGWHGRPDFQSGASVQYLCVSYLAPGDEGRTCGDFYEADRPLSEAWVRELN